MSLLPEQILPETVPLGKVLPNGDVKIDHNWFLLIYNICLQVLGAGQAGGFPASAVEELASVESDANDSDAVAFRQPLDSLTVQSLADPFPSPTADILGALAGLLDIPGPTQQVDANSSPRFVAVKIGNILRTALARGWIETDGNLLYFTDTALARLPIQRTIFTQTATVTVANSTTETTLIGAGVGSVTLPANYGFAGKTVLFEGWGIHSATGSPGIRIRIYKGTTLLLDTGTITSGNSTDNLVQYRAQITWRSATSVWAQGFYQESGGGQNNFEMANTAARTVNSTAEALNVTVQWGTASTGNSISMTNLTIRECN